MCKAITEGRALDIIEIDAASHTGVDECASLSSACNYAPAQARYKVYIIDEVHMLSDSASNALLKTLEEPPPKVIFILATTETHKVLPTIVSRCQRFDFHRSRRHMKKLAHLPGRRHPDRGASLRLVAAAPAAACGTPRTCWSSLPYYGAEVVSLRCRKCWAWPETSAPASW